LKNSWLLTTSPTFADHLFYNRYNTRSPSGALGDEIAAIPGILWVASVTSWPGRGPGRRGTVDCGLKWTRFRSYMSGCLPGRSVPRVAGEGQVTLSPDKEFPRVRTGHFRMSVGQPQRFALQPWLFPQEFSLSFDV